MALHADSSAYEIPRSRGVPPVVRLLFLAGIVVIIVVGWVSVHFAHEFHLWPAKDVETKTPVTGRF